MHCNTSLVSQQQILKVNMHVYCVLNKRISIVSYDLPANNFVLTGSFMVREDSEVQGGFATIILDQIPGAS